MSTKVELKTQELGEAILEHLQSANIRQRLDAFLADAAARGQYETVMSQGQALQEKQQSGQKLEDAEIAGFEKERDALLKNPIAAAFLDAQEEMHDLQHKVQKFVAKTMELGRLPVAEDLESCGSHGHSHSHGGGGGCCGGGGGCH